MNLWLKNEVFSREVIDPLLVIAGKHGFGKLEVIIFLQYTCGLLMGSMASCIRKVPI